MQEEWREIEVQTKRKEKVYNLTYLVSNLGNVKAPERQSPTRWGTLRTIPEREIKIFPMNRGYLKCAGGLIHQLVARAFIPNPNKLRDVNHKDGNKQNNRVDNLEWVSHSRNLQHYFETSDKPLESGVFQPLRVYNTDGKWLGDFKSTVEACKFMDTSPNNVQQYFHRKGKFIGKDCYIIEKITKDELQDKKERQDLPSHRVPPNPPRKCKET